MSHPPYGPPPPPYGHAPPPPGGIAFVPAPVMMPLPIYPPQPPPPEATYVTNHYYPPPEPVQVVDNVPLPAPEIPVVDWVPITANDTASYSHRAVVGGKEGWDGSPLWVIRAYYNGDTVPGKLAVKHRSAYIPHSGREIPVHNFELMCAFPGSVRWIPARNGQVPAGAVVAGNTDNGEPLYSGRFYHMRSLTPGKVHPSHGCCYISFGGGEVSSREYEVLCKVVG